jgi:hypothetical protein
MSPASLYPRADTDALERLVRLVYELLDAHEDTAELLSCPAIGMLQAGEVRWRAHLEYLRALQRKGREILAGAEASFASDPARGSP